MQLTNNTLPTLAGLKHRRYTKLREDSPDSAWVRLLEPFFEAVKHQQQQCWDRAAASNLLDFVVQQLERADAIFALVLFGALLSN